MPETKKLEPIGEIHLDEHGRAFVFSSGQKYTMYEAEELKRKIEGKKEPIHIYTTED